MSQPTSPTHGTEAWRGTVTRATARLAAWREGPLRRFSWRLDTSIGLITLFASAFLIRALVAPRLGFYGDIRFFRVWTALLDQVGPRHFYDKVAFSDYPPGYLYVLWLTGKVSSTPSYFLIKLPAMLADLGLAWIAGTYAARLAPETLKKRWPVRTLVAAAVLFNPAVILLGAGWGQVDSVPALFMLASLLVLFTKPATLRYESSGFLLFGVAIAMKPQAGLALPIMLYALYRRHLEGRTPRNVARGALEICLVGAPAFGVWALSGLAFGLGPIGLLQFYRASANGMPVTSANAFNLWGAIGFLRNDAAGTNPLSIAGVSALHVGTFLFLAALIVVIWRMHRTIVRGAPEALTLTIAAASVALLAYALLTRMHERYLFAALAILAPLVIVRPLRYAYVALSALFILSLWYPYAHWNAAWDPSYGLNTLDFNPWYGWLTGGDHVDTWQKKVWSLAVTAIALLVAWQGARWAIRERPSAGEAAGLVAGPPPLTDTVAEAKPASAAKVPLRAWLATLQQRPPQRRGRLGSIEVAHPLAIGILFALGFASILLMVWSVFHGGIGWDSRNDTNAALAIQGVNSSWTLAHAYAFVPDTSEFYGAFLQQFADVLHGLTSGSLTHLAADDSETYVYQGLANVILAVGSVTALAVALAVTLRSLLAAVFAWALILATPLWLGMSHVDFKDMPIAAGLTLITTGLLLSASLERRLTATLVGVVLAGAGGSMVLATRAGSLPLLLALAGGSLIGIWAVGRRRHIPLLPVALTSTSALAFALGFVYTTNPLARISLPRWLWDSTEIARDFPHVDTILTAGRELSSADLPWWYAPAWLGAQLPVLTIAALLGSIVVFVAALARRRTTIETGPRLLFVPVTIQAVVLPIVIVVSGAVLYDGIRHLLFAFPALLSIPAVALVVLDRNRDLRPRLAALAPAMAIFVVAASLLASIQWAPYSYAYINPIAGHDKDGRSWELDYWGVSAREGVTRMHHLGYPFVEVQPSPQPGIPWGETDVLTHRGSQTGIYVFLRRNRAADFGCPVLFTIRRGGHILGEGARCPAVP